jgi:hypothetical protein
MSNGEKWLAFRYQYIETGWFDYDRPKTIEAMRKICERVPDDVLDSLPPLTLFAPSSAPLGRVLPFGSGDGPFVYLAPHLERKSQAEVDFTVAHEFAHVALSHYRAANTATTVPLGVLSHDDAPSEQEADSCAESWGFKKPKGRIHAAHR